MTLVTIERSVLTDVGEIAPGTSFPAVPDPDGGWILEMGLPGASHPVHVPATAVTSGRFLLTKEAAQHDYTHAREVLGYTPRQARDWLIHGYGATARQLQRWGIAAEEFES